MSSVVVVPSGARVVVSSGSRVVVSCSTHFGQHSPSAVAETSLALHTGLMQSGLWQWIWPLRQVQVLQSSSGLVQLEYAGSNMSSARHGQLPSGTHDDPSNIVLSGHPQPGIQPEASSST